MYAQSIPASHLNDQSETAKALQQRFAEAATRTSEQYLHQRINEFQNEASAALKFFVEEIDKLKAEIAALKAPKAA